jgi:threonine dehydrogenase-like Zn-dependent dehydrogenase
MHGAVLHATGDVRLDDLPEPVLHEPTDAVVRITASCICGTDLWDFRGPNPAEPKPIGHEYCGIVEQVGDGVTQFTVGQFVIGPFRYCDNTCQLCRAGVQSSCPDGAMMHGCQSEAVRVPLADGSLVATPSAPDPELVPSLLALSDVMGTGWYAAECAQVEPGSTVAVVGDGAVGLCGVLAAEQKGAARIIAMSRHSARQQLAREFGATDIVAERGSEGAEIVKDLTKGIGVDCVLECVGTPESMAQALHAVRPGGSIGFVGMPHGTPLPAAELFHSQVGLRGGTAPVRRFLPDLIRRVYDQKINPGRVFDMALPLTAVAEGYEAMNQRRAIKVLLRP